MTEFSVIFSFIRIEETLVIADYFAYNKDDNMIQNMKGLIENELFGKKQFW
jgi:hypothetical protein